LAGIGHTAEDADGLLYELERATVVADAAVPDDVVRMGTTVRFRADGTAEREVELVYPKDADIEAGKVSVMTPVGTALIGLRRGQSITWVTRDGRKQVLTVLAVSPPMGDGPGPLAA
jgi:regulator of nucleoside diphosphate kinase